ncbi:MAG: SRPBCC family protein [Candidatus Binatia bacterium]
MAMHHPMEHSRSAPQRFQPSARRAGGNGYGTVNEGLREHQRTPEERLAHALGWFSIGVGVAEAVAPRTVARALGLADSAPQRGRQRIPWSLLGAQQSDSSSTLRLFGLREIGTGLGILTRRRPAGWLWARVLGDLLDLGFLSKAMQSTPAHRGRLATAAVAVAGVTALDIACSRQLSARKKVSLQLEPDGSARVVHNLAINRPPEECYAFWRGFENLPRIMPHLERVETRGERLSHWVAKGPGGVRLEWDAEITEEVPGQLIAWRSLPGGDVDVEGAVRFQPGERGQGTILRVTMRYRSPAGAVGVMLAKMFGVSPEKQIREDLRRFKQLMETGEIVTTAGQPMGPARGSIVRALSSATSGRERSRMQAARARR